MSSLGPIQPYNVTPGAAGRLLPVPPGATQMTVYGPAPGIGPLYNLAWLQGPAPTNLTQDFVQNFSGATVQLDVPRAAKFLRIITSANAEFFVGWTGDDDVR